ncbi:phage major capsid protein [Sphingomonas sp. Mn802worker]|uniref:phage major capsid protein n=1 Tax=Sphingomonas sp. Mn802worker TaxID=629773 RepID=UPI00035CB7E0|nr:phage major capsid protein [Sphingomonas sp. Mn802worker]
MSIYQVITGWMQSVTGGGGQGTFLVGAFKVAATLYDRLKPEVLISSENADDFEKNLLTMRCEERLGLAVKRPAALIKGPFANA